MSIVFLCAAKSVLTILLAAFAGTLLVKFKVLNSDSIRVLSKIVVYVTLPTLLTTKVAYAIDLKTLQEIWILPLSAFLYIIVGFALAKLLNIFLKFPDDLKGVMTASSTLGNSGYLPLPLIVAICAIFPIFIKDPDASARGITYISAYIMVFSPLLWIFGYNAISGRGAHQLKWNCFFPPPVIGILIGLLIGLTPFLKNNFCFSDGLFFPIFESGKIIAAATVPLALIVLGGRFAIPQKEASLDNKVIISVATLKLFILPIIAIGYLLVLRYFSLISKDPMLTLVLVIEAAVPPANNLILMASMHKKNENVTAKILFWCYITSTISLTLFIALAMIIFS